jgi:hypothetical protein
MKTILVIEDQPLMRQKAVTILKMEGYEVLRPGSKGARLQLWPRWRFSLVRPLKAHRPVIWWIEGLAQIPTIPAR